MIKPKTPIYGRLDNSSGESVLVIYQGTTDLTPALPKG
jgi:hypothetical protein